MPGYRSLLDDPSTVQAICEDYHAATLDREHDDADRGRRRIECPLLALWSADGALPACTGTCSTCGGHGPTMSAVTACPPAIS